MENALNSIWISIKSWKQPENCKSPASNPDARKKIHFSVAFFKTSRWFFRLKRWEMNFWAKSFGRCIREYKKMHPRLRLIEILTLNDEETFESIKNCLPGPLITSKVRRALWHLLAVIYAILMAVLMTHHWWAITNSLLEKRGALLWKESFQKTLF